MSRGIYGDLNGGGAGAVGRQRDEQARRINDDNNEHSSASITDQGEEVCVAVLQAGAVGLMAGVSHFSLDISRPERRRRRRRLGGRHTNTTAAGTAEPMPANGHRNGHRDDDGGDDGATAVAHAKQLRPYDGRASTTTMRTDIIATSRRKRCCCDDNHNPMRCPELQLRCCVFFILIVIDDGESRKMADAPTQCISTRSRTHARSRARRSVGGSHARTRIARTRTRRTHARTVYGPHTRLAQHPSHG